MKKKFDTPYIPKDLAIVEFQPMQQFTWNPFLLTRVGGPCYIYLHIDIQEVKNGADKKGDGSI